MSARLVLRMTDDASRGDTTGVICGPDKRGKASVGTELVAALLDITSNQTQTACLRVSFPPCTSTLHVYPGHISKEALYIGQLA